MRSIVEFIKALGASRIGAMVAVTWTLTGFHYPLQATRSRGLIITDTDAFDS